MNRIQLQLNSSSFIIVQIKITVILSGFIATYAFLTFSPSTLLGFNINNLQSTLAPSIFTLVACIYLAEAVGESMVSCLNSILLCKIADEEMFTGQQRFVSTDMHFILEGVSSEAKNSEAKNSEAKSSENRALRLNPEETQRPGRSYRINANLVDFDEKFNVVPANKTSNSSKIQEKDLDIQDYDYQSINRKRL